MFGLDNKRLECLLRHVRILARVFGVRSEDGGGRGGRGVEVGRGEGGSVRWSRVRSSGTG